MIGMETSTGLSGALVSSNPQLIRARVKEDLEFLSRGSNRYFTIVLVILRNRVNNAKLNDDTHSE